MKIFLILLLGASFAANVVLFKNRDASRSSSSLPPTPASAHDPAASLTVPTLSADIWALVQSGDPSSPEKLRALGLDEASVNALIRSQVDARYRDREKALQADPASVPYWDYRYAFSRYRSPDPLKALDLRREKTAELKALLGDDYRKNDDYVDFRTAFLPPGKAEELRLLIEDYDALTQSAASIDGGILLPEDREKLAYLEKQKREDLAALLTPDELLAYDMRNSNTTQSLRYQLAGLDPTEEEFTKIYAVRKAHDEKYAPQNATGTNSIFITPPGSASARKEFEDQIKAALGDDRYAAYQRSTDPDYRIFASLARRLDLPPERAAEAYDLKAALQQKINDFKPQPGTPPNEQRAAYLATITREAEAGFTQLLGSKGFEAFKENSSFFRRLTPAAVGATSNSTTTTQIITLP